MVIREVVPRPFYNFSVLSPYRIANDGDTLLLGESSRRQEGNGYDSRYLRLQIQSLHSLPKEVPDLIRKELRRLFFEETAHNLRQEHEYKLFWLRDASITLRGASMTRIDERRPPQHFINPADAHQFLNKEVMVYFEPTSVSDFYTRKIGCYIYREWLHLHNMRPIFQRDSFFAKAAHISNSNSGPQNLEQLSIFHHHLCEQLSAKMDQLVDFYPNRPSAPPLWGPMPSRKIQSWRDHGHIMRHLFRALYIVVDRQALAEEPPPRRLEHLEAFNSMEAEAELDLSRCTVLLVKTGDEAHLHSPISFLPLFEAGLALPVNREDYRGDLEETVVRVKLNVAVRFVLKLLGREEAALKNLRWEAKVLRDEQERYCDAWLNKVMAHSDEVGIDNNRHTWLASRRALARMNNEAFEEDQAYPAWEILRRWTL